jgi:hypothetical protein
MKKILLVLLLVVLQSAGIEGKAQTMEVVIEMMWGFP